MPKLTIPSGRDLLDRHKAIHSSVSRNAEHQIKRRNRAAKACTQCILSKTKCSDERPCQRCRTRGQTCDPEPEVSVMRPPGSSTQFETDARASSPVLGSRGASRQQESESEPLVFLGSQTQEQLAASEGNGTADPLAVSLEGTQQNVECHNTANCSAVSSLWDNDIFSTDSTLDIDDDILMAMDLDWNSLIQLDFDSSNEDPSSRPLEHLRGGNDLTNGSRPRGLLVREFFKRSLWLWEPDARDTASMEEAPHLSEVDERLFLSTGRTEKASDERVAGASWSAALTCGNEARDALLLLAQRNSENTAALRCFPSPSVLTFLLRAFAIQETVSRCPFLHLPSFQVDKCRIELLSALVVAGSANFANRKIWKLGLALQERTRIAIYKTLGHNNSLAPDSDILQAQILWVEAGLWSGVRRKMEVAESAANNLPFVGCMLSWTNIRLNVTDDTTSRSSLFGILRPYLDPYISRR